MEEYKRIKLVRLSRTELRNKEMRLLKGGAEDKCCGCGYGTANRDANSSAGYSHSSGSIKGDCWRWVDNNKGGWDPAKHESSC